MQIEVTNSKLNLQLLTKANQKLCHIWKPLLNMAKRWSGGISNKCTWILRLKMNTNIYILSWLSYTTLIYPNRLSQKMVAFLKKTKLWDFMWDFKNYHKSLRTGLLLTKLRLTDDCSISRIINFFKIISNIHEGPLISVPLFTVMSLVMHVF